MKELHNNIFSETACISKETMLRYINHDLSDKEIHEVQKHLIECSFCSEAMEGYSYLKNPSKLMSIDAKIDALAKKKKSAIGSRLMMAASILVIALGTYFTYLLSQDINTNQEKLSINEPTDKAPKLENSAETEPISNLSEIELKKDLKEELNLVTEGINLQEAESDNINSPVPPAPKMVETATLEDDFEMNEEVEEVLLEDAEMIEEQITFSDAEMEMPIEEASVVGATTIDLSNNVNAGNSVTTIDELKTEEDNKNKDRKNIAGLFKNNETRNTKSKAKKSEAPKGFSRSSTDVDKFHDDEVTKSLDFDTNVEEEEKELSQSFVAENEKGNSTDNLEKGISNYNQQNYDEAISYLDLSISEAPINIEECYWYKALCLIELNQSNDAKFYLKEIINLNKTRVKDAQKKLSSLD